MTTTTATDSLICRLESLGEDGDETILSSQELLLTPDDTKKSVFWMHDPMATIAPAQLTVNVQSTNSSNENGIFLVGGFQLFSNARHVEVYLETEHDALSYLTTCRGIACCDQQQQNHQNGGTLKALCVIPGGPKPVRRLVLKLKGVNDDETAKITSLKLTARLPPRVAAADSNVTNQTQQQQQQHPESTTGLAQPAITQQQQYTNTTTTHNNSNDNKNLTHEDLGAAMASFSFVLRQTEARVTQSLLKELQSQARRIEQQTCLIQSLQQQQAMLTSVVNALHQRVVANTTTTAALQQETLSRTMLKEETIEEPLQQIARSKDIDMTDTLVHADCKSNTPLDDAANMNADNTCTTVETMDTVTTAETPTSNVPTAEAPTGNVTAAEPRDERTRDDTRDERIAAETPGEGFCAVEPKSRVLPINTTDYDQHCLPVLTPFRDGEHCGEATLEDILEGIDNGELTDGCQVFDSLHGEWIPAETLVE
jgi:hypothetical protein